MSAKITTKVLKSVDEANENQWNNLVSQSKLGGFYHRFGWLKALEKTFDGKARHIIVRKNSQPIGIMPVFKASIAKTFLKRLYSTRRGYGGPVILSEEKIVLDKILDEIKTINGCSTVAHRIKIKDLRQLRYLDFLEDHGYRITDVQCRFELNLQQDWNEIKSRMDKDRRYSLRKAKERDYKIEEKEKITNSFYSDYVESKKRVGAKPKPRSFFQSINRLEEDRVKLFTAYVNGKEIGHHLYLLDNEMQCVNHLSSGVREENFEYYPSELIHEHMIKWAQNNKYSFYDFGETSASFSDGLFKYKEKYGGRVVPTITLEKGSKTSKAVKLGKNYIAGGSGG